MSECQIGPPHEGTAVVVLDDTGGVAAAPPQTTDLSIGNVARMFGVSQWALRRYELRRLIARRNRRGRMRFYSWADCERLVFIIKCRKAGLPLRTVAAILRAAEDDVTPAVSARGRELCAAELTRLQEHRRALDEALAELAHVAALLAAKLAEPDPLRGD
jgi:DNA-binding transcriptional MerR regulator